MRIGVLGINYKSSCLHLREIFAKACHRCFIEENKEKIGFAYVLLSTCNRCEIYFCAEDLAAKHSELLSLLRQEIHLPFEHKLYSYFGVDCFTHLAMVTAGLDSVIVGETEIQRQVKTAYENACLDQTLSSSLHFLFQKCLKIGKQIRAHFTLPFKHSSLEKVIFHISNLFLEDIQNCKVFFIGNSEINRKILAFFRNKKIQNMALCTRAAHNAAELSTHFGIQIKDWHEKAAWQDCELLICGTNLQKPFILWDDLKDSREIKTQLILDLSVPRSVDPKFRLHPRISLLNMEEINRWIEKQQHSHLKEIEKIGIEIRREAEKCVFAFQEKIKSECYALKSH